MRTHHDWISKFACVRFFYKLEILIWPRTYFTVHRQWKYWLIEDVMMSTVASQITGVSIVCPTVCSGVDQRKHQSSASLAFVRGIHMWLGDFSHKGPVTRKMFPFDDVIMNPFILHSQYHGSLWLSSLRRQGISSHGIELHRARLNDFPCMIWLLLMWLFSWV